jgi:hypothetical protein
MGTWLGLGAPVPQGLQLAHRKEANVRISEKWTWLFADAPVRIATNIVHVQEGSIDTMLWLQDGPLPAGLFFSGQATRIPPPR